MQRGIGNVELVECAQISEITVGDGIGKFDVADEANASMSMLNQVFRQGIACVEIIDVDVAKGVV